MHLAAQASVTVVAARSRARPAVNAEGTRRVARPRALPGRERVISASSAAVYGEPAELPLTEASPTAPMNPYGASKLEAEGLLAERARGQRTSTT